MFASTRAASVRPLAAGGVVVTWAYDRCTADDDLSAEDTRWFIVDRTNDEPVLQPTDGFASRDDAEAHHVNVLRGDMGLVVRAIRRR